MISARILRTWRKDALVAKKECNNLPPQEVIEIMLIYSSRILQLTQELLDQHLMKK